jgi:glutamate/tyrosine decarboxylase-like PLP-dependent enzyme
MSGYNMIDTDSLELLGDAVKTLQQGFASLPASEQRSDPEKMMEVLTRAALRMQDNYPYFHPLYAGQMLKPPHPVARLAYTLAMFINPNNHALDGGRASSAMEKESVANIAGMIGWQQHLGHLSSGGTMANLEALWVGGKLNPGKTILASSQAHYTHSRISEVLGLAYESVAVDRLARMDITALEKRLQKGDIGTVVATLGTTGAGAVDPLPAMLALRNEFGFRLHVDAAYGGYFVLAENLDNQTRAAFDCIGAVDSVVIDPHKHGLQPYGCGCILFKDPAVGRFYQHDSPYTYFSSDELHLGEISLECSRAGAAAVALWATQQLLPMQRGAEFARDLEKCHSAAMMLYQRLAEEPRYRTIFRPELDIVIWAPAAASASGISALSRLQFKQAAANNLHLALVDLPGNLAGYHWDDVDIDTATVTCLRSCLMKPEHLDWIDRIWAILEEIAGC